MIINSAVARVKSTHLPPSLSPLSLSECFCVSVCERQGGAHNKKGEEEALLINKNTSKMAKKSSKKEMMKTKAKKKKNRDKNKERTMKQKPTNAVLRKLVS